MAKATRCDTRCLYAMSEDGCDCVCGGENHGRGDNIEIRTKQQQRHAKTRRAFKAHLDNTDGPKARRSLYKNRELFNKEFAKWSGQEPVVETVHQSGNTVTVIKDKKIGDDTYSHIRRNTTNKTEYWKNEKVITKAQLPAELGW